MFLSQLANVFRQIRTRTMLEFEKNKDAIRQTAATAVAVAAVAALMPAVSHRASEQRADAEWAARAKAFHAALAAAETSTDAAPAAQLTLASASSADRFGYKAFGAAGLDEAAVSDGHAMFVQTRVRERLAVSSLARFSSDSLQLAADRSKEIRCLAEAIYYEARSESIVGQLAVAEVVVNRVKSKHYPDSFCGVVYEGSYRSTGCQFTFTCDGSMRHRPYGASWRQANVIAGSVIRGFARPVTHRATHYHTDEVDPYWSGSLIETTRIGAHIFYRMPNRIERARLRDAAQEQQEAAAPVAASVDQVAAATAVDGNQPT
jgi:spore germination cell wall hydrolase CwlJ-like protein